MIFLYNIERYTESMFCPLGMDGTGGDDIRSPMTVNGAVGFRKGCPADMPVVASFWGDIPGVCATDYMACMDTNISPVPRTPFHEDGLAVLLRLSSEIPNVQDLETLERIIAEALFQVSSASRVAILLSLGGCAAGAEVLGWDRELGGGQKIRVRQALLDGMISAGLPVIHNDIFENGKTNGKFLAVAAAPLATFEALRGAIYLEADGVNGRFEDEIADFLGAIGSLAAVAFENVRRREWQSDESIPAPGGASIAHDMIGNSASMREVFEFIRRVAPKDSTVLVSGESGTGKELVAQAIHANGGRAGKPFVAINCAALTDTLLESELFGHERGSFTGAFAQKKGKLEVAEGGTVFLDEVGEMSPALQAKVLRVLQEREFERIGGTKTHKLNIRLIAATNRDLRAESQRGGFRQDLFFRLNVVSITMPALRERREDIPALAAYFAAKYGTRMGRPIAGVSRDARLLLMAYEWPGNVRELENAIEQAVVLGSSEMILPGDLPRILSQKAEANGGPKGLADGLREAKKQIILQALDHSAGNQAEAAEELGVHPNHLSRLMKTLQLRPARRAR